MRCKDQIYSKHPAISDTVKFLRGTIPCQLTQKIGVWQILATVLSECLSSRLSGSAREEQNRATHHSGKGRNFPSLFERTTSDYWYDTADVEAIVYTE